uniref:Uncharacterized protein n=1 Tax=Mesocestoides corti TaxID=53468 RepID=A0A5K3FY89_MESCO
MTRVTVLSNPVKAFQRNRERRSERHMPRERQASPQNVPGTTPEDIEGVVVLEHLSSRRTILRPKKAVNCLHRRGSFHSIERASRKTQLPPTCTVKLFEVPLNLVLTMGPKPAGGGSKNASKASSDPDFSETDNAFTRRTFIQVFDTASRTST